MTTLHPHVMIDAQHERLLAIQKGREDARIRSARRRRRQREGLVPITIEINEINIAERFNLGGEPSRRQYRDVVQAFIDRELNCVTV